RAPAVQPVVAAPAVRDTPRDVPPGRTRHRGGPRPASRHRQRRHGQARRLVPGDPHELHARLPVRAGRRSAARGRMSAYTIIPAPPDMYVRDKDDTDIWWRVLAIATEDPAPRAEGGDIHVRYLVCEERNVVLWVDA